MAKYDPETKARHVNRYRDLVKSDFYTLPSEYAREMGINASTFCKWLRDAGVKVERWMDQHGRVTG